MGIEEITNNAFTRLGARTLKSWFLGAAPAEIQRVEAQHTGKHPATYTRENIALAAINYSAYLGLSMLSHAYGQKVDNDIARSILEHAGTGSQIYAQVGLANTALRAAYTYITNKPCASYVGEPMIITIPWKIGNMLGLPMGPYITSKYSEYRDKIDKKVEEIRQNAQLI